MASSPTPFTRLNYMGTDPQIQRIIQDMYDKLAKLQSELDAIKKSIPP